MANIDSKYDSFIHFMIKFNSKDFSISFFSGIFIFNSKSYSTTFFLENSIQKLIQKIEFGLIQFNKIFIQLENQAIKHHSEGGNFHKFQFFLMIIDLKRSID